MPCDTTGEFLSALLDGELGFWQARRWRRHLATCERCRQLQSELQAARRVVRERLPAEEPPPDLWPGIEARMAGVDVSSAPRATARPRMWSTAALAVAAAAILMPIYLLTRTEPLDAAALVQVQRTHLVHSCETARDVESSTEAAQWLSERLGFQVQPLKEEQAGLRVVRATACRCVNDREGALMLARVDDHLVAFYQAPARGLRPFPGRRMRAGGRQFTLSTLNGRSLVAWREDDVEYATIADMEAKQLLKLSRLAYAIGSS